MYLFFFKVFVTDTKSIEYKHALSGQCRLIKTDKTEQLIASFEVEQQGYRHFLMTCLLTLNNWYNTTLRVGH